MTLSTARNYAIVLLTVSAAAVASRAVPVSSLGLPDRDVVRNPYGNFSPISGGFIAPHNSSIVGPNLGLGSSFPPSLLLGGGGGGGGSAGFGGSASAGSVPSFSALAANAPNVSNAGPTSPGGSSGNSGNSGSSSAPSTTITFSAQTNQSAVASVPDAGASVILMGSSLLGLCALRRRLGGFSL